MYKKFYLITIIIVLSLFLTGCFTIQDEIKIHNLDGKLLKEIKENSSVETIATIVFNANKIDGIIDVDIDSFDYKITFKGNVNESYLFKVNEDYTGSLINEYDTNTVYSLNKENTHNLLINILNVKFQLETKEQ